MPVQEQTKLQEIRKRKMELTKLYNRAANDDSLSRPWESDDVKQMAAEYSRLLHEEYRLTGKIGTTPGWVWRWFH